jgi:hypothetical protein
MYEDYGNSVKTGSYPGECLEQAQKSNRIPTTRERLTERKLMLEKHLVDLNAALEALDKFPEFEQIHNLLTKAQL